MTVPKFRGVIRRRWHLAVVGVAATVVAAFVAWSSTPPTYTALGSVMLMPSPRQASRTGNPFLSFASLESISGVVMARLDSPDEHARFADLMPTAAYEVGPDLTTRGPTVLMTVTDETAAGTMAALSLVMDWVPETLAGMQEDAGVEKDSVVGWMPLARDERPTVNGDDAVTAAFLAGGTTLTAAAVLTVGVDLLMARARRRRKRTVDVRAGTPAAADDLRPVQIGSPRRAH